MKVVVTGAAGFIGSHLSEKLKSLGHDVVGVDCFTDYYEPALKKLNEKDLKTQSISIHNLDLASDDLTQALNQAEVIFHLAAQPGISSTTPFDHYLKNNIVATQKLLDASLKIPSLKHFINIATSSVYGSLAVGDEKSEPKPTSFYGVTKLAAEQLALSYFRNKNFPASSVRLFSVYGERERPEKIYPKLIKSIFEDTEFTLYEGSDKHIRSYTYVSDIVDGLLAVMENREKSVGEIFNLGTEETITTGAGIKIVEDLIGKKAKIVTVPKRSGDQEKTQANITKAKELLNYHPSVSPREGLKKEVEWFKRKFYA